MLNQNLTLILCLSAVALLNINVIRADASNNDIAKESRIVNGTYASLDATRHQVSIRMRLVDSTSFGKGHICGGSLISNNMVLTAAHCLLNYTKSDGSFASKDYFIVAMGNLDRLEYNKNTLVYGIKEIIQWADRFNSTTLSDDIVLILLNGTVPANHPTMRPIRLNDGPIADNTICQVTGWGLNENHVLSNKLKSVDLFAVNVDECHKKFPLVKEGMICTDAFKDKGNPCSADSGGPLVCNGIQTGIVSFGPGTCTPEWPFVYADVAYYKNWILEKTSYYNGTLPTFAPVSGGVTSLSCSIFLICLMLVFNFVYDQIK